mmetsp:Transcript_7855/g.10515  ORF Transcript_7855/g.10515 Transcript_7855/m.10515 type:complete len:118 (+) Transcript_7855:987-1340(+)
MYNEFPIVEIECHPRSVGHIGFAEEEEEEGEGEIIGVVVGFVTVEGEVVRVVMAGDDEDDEEVGGANEEEVEVVVVVAVVVVVVEVFFIEAEVVAVVVGLIRCQAPWIVSSLNISEQ